MSHSSIIVRLMVGTPIEQYKQQKNKLEEYLKTRDFVQIWWNGNNNENRKLIWIKEVKVFPQAAASYFVIPNGLTKDSIIGIIDIGGFTVDSCLFSQGTFDANTMMTLPYGIKPLEAKVRDTLNSEFGIHLMDCEIQDKLKNGLNIYGQRITKADSIIDDIINEYVKNIINSLILRGRSLQTTQTILTGGGAILLGKYFKKQIPNIKILDNPQFSNVKGFFNIAKTVFK